MPKRLDPPFDVASFMEHGDQFHYNMVLIGRLSNDELARVITPFVVSAAFAVEVYFKVLANIERNLLPLKTHNLLHLFQDITPATQDQIEQEWTTRVLPKLQSTYSNPHLPPDFPRIATFRQALASSADAFTDWRYAAKSKDRSFDLPDLVPLVRRIIVAKRPDLVPKRIRMTPLNADSFPPKNQAR